MVEKFIYNLEFPPYITEFTVGDYSFKRIPDYSAAFGNLQHLIGSRGSEYPTRFQTGSHQITAVVEIPDSEKPAVLPWADKHAKQLSDVLLLLALFTGRNVVLKDRQEDAAIMEHHGLHLWGDQLRLSIKYEPMWKHRHTSVLASQEEIKGLPKSDYHKINVGLEKGLNAVLDLISSKSWLQRYSDGEFLLVFRQSLPWQIIETSFILCWAIWEHVFTVHNKRWLDEKTIFALGGHEKISFILNEYFHFATDDKTRKEVRGLAKTRNRIVHYGVPPCADDYEAMAMFIHLTEQLIALILGLQPSNAFNSFEKLQQFLKGQPKTTTRHTKRK